MIVVILYIIECVMVGVNSQLGVTPTQQTLTTCQNSEIFGLGWDTVHISNDESCGYHSCRGWYNTTMHGGWRQMASLDHLPGYCMQESVCERTLVIALTATHPDITTIDENIQTLAACAVNDTSMKCVFDVEVMVRKCGNDLTYYLLPFESGHPNWDITYGFERKYNHPCEEHATNMHYYHVNEEFIIDSYSGWPYYFFNGWRNSLVNGQQYVIPTVNDIQYFDRDNSELDRYWQTRDHYWIPAVDGGRKYWMQLNESDARLPICLVYMLEDTSNYKCHHMTYDIYASKCMDGIRYQIANYLYIVLVNSNIIHKPIVTPELRHDQVTAEFDGTLKNAYKPVLQFRCSFVIYETEIYTVYWYIDDVLVVTRGPSNNQDELLIDESDIPGKTTGLGFNIKCGYQVNEETNQTLSKNYFAGIKILDSDIQLSRQGSAIVRARLTVPMGCLHPASGESTCTYDLTLYDPHTNVDECFGALSITVENGERCSEEIKALKRGETWDPHTIYGFMVTTVEHTYDDKTDYNLRFGVPDSVSHTIWKGYQQDGVKVTVTESATSTNIWSSWKSYWYKMCYSRGDPHMKTTDGIWYSQHVEGDYMLYQNTLYQIEVQESTKFCFGDSGSVCECGIAVRAGQDVFMIDRCSGVNYLDFPYCGDGGILDVEVVNDYKYTVTTPIGTKIIIYTRRNFMSTRIIMSAKDFGNTEGLCGYFDGDWQNDFILIDGSLTDNNHYLFAESWRLSDETNLFKNSNRGLEKWSDNNTIICQCATDGFCEVAQYPGCRKSSSITKTKCGLPGQHSKERKRRYITPKNENIQKRSIDEAISNTTAIKMCNDSVYNSAAVKYFSDMLNEAEDPNEVVKQCVFDVLMSNDPDFTKMYVNEINSVVINFIELNPVYAANNTQAVEQFLLETCSNNCSNQGECLVTGQCSCHDFYRGPDCSMDIRIPPTIQDIHGGGKCDQASGDLCECFIVRTDHLFEGFMFNLHTTRVYFDGQHEQIGYSIQAGNHEDIFTGTVCVPSARNKRDDQQISDYVILYDVSLSNDGDTFGTAMSVLVYDSTCHNVVHNESPVVVNLTEGFCYISGTCIPDGTKDGCQICNSNDLPFKWTLANCDDNSGISNAVLIGISVGSAVCALVVIVFLVYKLFCGSRKNRVESVPDLTTSSFDGHSQPVSNNLHYTSKR